MPLFGKILQRKKKGRGWKGKEGEREGRRGNSNKISGMNFPKLNHKTLSE